MEIFNVKSFIRDFFYLKYNAILIVGTILLSLHTYLVSVGINNKFHLKKILIIFTIFQVLGVVYFYLIRLISTKLHTFGYLYIFKNILKIRKLDLNAPIDPSLYVSIINFVSFFDDVIIVSGYLLPFIISFFLILSYIFKTVGMKCGIFFIITIIIQILILKFKMKSLTPDLYKFNDERNNFANLNSDIHINFEQILSLNMENEEIEKLKEFSSILPFYYRKGVNNMLTVFANFTLINMVYTFISTYYIFKFKENVNVLAYFLVLLIYIINSSLQIKNIFWSIFIYSYINNYYDEIKKNLGVFNIKNDDLRTIVPNINNTLQIRNLTLVLNDNIIYKNFNFNFELNKTYILIGKIGVGKSMLIKILFGIIKFQEGNIQLNNILLTPKNYDIWRENFNYVPQSAVIFNRSIEENLFYSSSNKEQVITLFKKVGIYTDIMDILNKSKKNKQLSGGQKQIIILSRILYSPKKIILLDEPTASLDSKSKEIVFKIINYLRNEKKTIILITHDKDILDLADEIIDIEDIKKKQN
ncbi:ABC transporter [seawater metagenome]|uniref:ABC transporter n=1 Tax=seawater metagenome TaxID=1561972 RepID=A0A5E8CMC2_9ZZZZ